MPLFGSSGIRQVLSRDLLNLAFEVGLALSRDYNNIITGRDTRTSGPALQYALIAGVISGGARCSDAGVLPTPTLACAAAGFKAGAMITASHNPPEYNGIKLLNPDGSAFSPAQQDRIEESIRNRSTGISRWSDFKPVDVFPGAVSHHAAKIAAFFNRGIKVRVVLDCGGGAACGITPGLLIGLGCEVVRLNCEPADIFPHDVEPIEANLGDLKSAVLRHHADLGIAHDGDADRMMAVDNLGRYISGDKMLAVLAGSYGEINIVTTIDTSMSIEKFGYKTIRTRVGDPFVSAAVKEGACKFGGETSGAWVFPEISYCPDGIYAAARIAWIAYKNRLSDVVDALPSYPLVRGSIKGDLKAIERFACNMDRLNPVRIDRTDGIKLEFNDGWILVRPSGTELKVRITAEALTVTRARELYAAAETLLLEV